MRSSTPTRWFCAADATTRKSPAAPRASGREVDESARERLAGTPAELVRQIGRYREAGSQRIYLQMLDLADLDHIELVASEVMPQIG